MHAHEGTGVLLFPSFRLPPPLLLPAGCHLLVPVLVWGDGIGYTQRDATDYICGEGISAARGRRLAEWCGLGVDAEILVGPDVSCAGP